MTLRPEPARRAGTPTVARSLCAILLIASAAACSTSGTAPCADGSAAAGSWRFASTRDSPYRATATGTLALRTRACGGVDGLLDVVETDAEGLARRSAGPVSGSAPDAASIRFEVVIDGVTLHHVGLVRGDSLTGSWAALAGNTPAGSGRFRAARETAR